MSHDTPPGATNGRRAIGLEAITKPRKTEYVEIDGYDGPFKVREVTYGERIAAVNMGKKDNKDGDGYGDTMFMPRIIAYAWINDDGSLVVESPVGGAEQVAKLGSAAVLGVYKRIADMSAFGEESRADMGKDLERTPTASGG